MGWDDRHPYPSCGKEHEERDLLKQRTSCRKIFCGGKADCPNCESGGYVNVT